MSAPLGTIREAFLQPERSINVTKLPFAQQELQSILNAYAQYTRKGPFTIQDLREVIYSSVVTQEQIPVSRALSHTLWPYNRAPVFIIEDDDIAKDMEYIRLLTGPLRPGEYIACGVQAISPQNDPSLPLMIPTTVISRRIAQLRFAIGRRDYKMDWINEEDGYLCLMKAMNAP